jgi:hypothetical protein
MTALDIAITMCQNQVKEHPKCYIFTGSQAAGILISQPRMQSVQSIVHSTINRIESIMSKRARQQPRLEIIWIPGHHEIAGNERANSEAKHAATNSTLSQQFKHKPLKSSRVQYIKDAAKKQWQKEWAENTKTGTHLQGITRRGNCGPKLYNQINNRRTTTQIAQLRTGYCALNKYLHRFGRRSSLHILQMRVWKANSSTLFDGMLKLQGTKRSAEKECGTRKNETSRNIRKYKDDKADNGIY